MSKKTLIAAAAGTAFAAALAAPVATAARTPFALSALSSGYQVADNHAAKPMEGKCGGMKAAEGMCGISMADANKDGKVSKEEFTKQHDAIFSRMDANKDGALDKAEMSKMMDGKCGDGKCGTKAMEGKCGAAK